MAIEDSYHHVTLAASHAQAVRSALQQWSKAKLIDSDLHWDLLTTIQVTEERYNFDWQKLAKYSFRLAILCFMVAIMLAIEHHIFPNFIYRIFDLPITLCGISIVFIVVMLHTWGYRRSLIKPKEIHLNEAIHCLGAYVLAFAASQLDRHLELNRSKNSYKSNFLMLPLASIYILIAIFVKSNFIWSCEMIVLGISFGNYFPAESICPRFVLLGTAMICTAYLMRYSRHTVELWSTTRIWGMLYLFNPLWFRSIFPSAWTLSDIFGGSTLTGREKIGLFLWSLAFFFAAALSVLHGLRFRDSTTKGFGLAYLGIHLGSKCLLDHDGDWDNPVLFIMLAFPLALLGKYAEHMNILLLSRYDKLLTRVG
ncbi:hypothetical protein F4804DRAFT_132338 [Jackrogersella minutella]|nr:hypothetical protein F4804DRAFT_132338 [Jackrogersella minutella]